MTFDKTKPFKCIDGLNINLTSTEITQLATNQATWAAEASTLLAPDLATQVANLTQALIDNNVLPPTAIDPATLTAINSKLTSLGKDAIALTASPDRAI